MDVSIVITAYNYSSYIEECINSCIQQKKNPLKYEVIVVDDGSTDDTPELLNNIKNKLLRKYRIKNSGIEIASNFGFSKALGKYIVRVDADDKLKSNYLLMMQRNLTDKFDFYYSDYEIINGDGMSMGEMNLPSFEVPEIKARGDFLATGTLYSSSALRKVAFYSEAVRNSGLENYELILKMLCQKMVGKHIPEKLFCYRRHSLNLSSSRLSQILMNGEILFHRLGLGQYGTNKFHPYIAKRGSL